MNLNLIDLKSLSLILSKKLGYYVELTGTVKVGRDGKEILDVVSQELKNYAGIMSSMYESLTIENFAGNVTNDGLSYWMPIHFSFSYVSAGSNGTQILTAWWMFETSEWVVK